jgi:hypothetical protein
MQKSRLFWKKEKVKNEVFPEKKERPFYFLLIVKLLTKQDKTLIINIKSFFKEK